MIRWKTLALISIAALHLTQPVRADEPQDTLPADNRIRMLEYNTNDIYTIMTRIGYQTNIEFSTHEEIETISVGDRSFWQIIPSGNRLFIRPMQEDVDTNMTVITSKRSYQFDLSSTSDKDKRITYVARFVYPDARSAASMSALADPFNYEARSTAAAMRPPVAPARLAPFKSGPSVPPSGPEFSASPEPVRLSRDLPIESAPVDAAPVNTSPKRVKTPAAVPSREAGKRNYRYTFSGPEGLAPYEVYDDGVATYFRYRPPIATSPDAVQIETGGEERTLPVYEKDGFFAVDAVAPVIVLRRAEGTVYVYNETLAPRY